MSDTPTTTDDLYNHLHHLSHTFIHASDCNKSTDPPTPMSIETITTHLSPTYIHTWGHNLYKTTHPSTADTLDLAGFIAHLESSSQAIHSSRTEITDTLIDTRRRRVMLRVSYFLVVGGGGGGQQQQQQQGDTQRVVENDMVWILDFVEDEKEKELKIGRGVEFVDGDASALLGLHIKRAMIGDS